VDNTMEVIGSSKKYQCLRKWIIGIIIGYIVFVFYQFAVFVLGLKFLYENNINFSLIYLIFLSIYPELVHVLNALICGIILGLVYM